ncbi:MAG: tRNA (cytidine(34)-2'-O)-methyltransferase [Opitutaceae bacterium]|nr:tRNA (cytidine(34)-2'-O)-methyltransferase [Opitutaceae bacterium]
MLHIVLHQPEIPQNTGNIGRLCAITKSRLHLIHPLGFEITDRHLKRSGMDYWNDLDVHHHDDWQSFKNSSVGPKRLWLFSTRGENSFWNASFEEDDGLVFGNESSGIPVAIHDELAATKVVIPQFDPKLRSLNLSTSVGIATYEAMRKVIMGKGVCVDLPGVS